MNRFLTAVVLLAAVCGASAARRTQWERLESAVGANDLKTLQWMQQGLLGRGGKGEKEQRAIIAFKYEVPPSMQDDFEHEWYKLEDETSREKGIMVYDLQKTLHDNTIYWIYGEWECMDDYFDHFRSSYLEKFLDFLDDNDIMWQLFPLKNMGDFSKERRETRTVVKDKGGGFDPRKNMAHVVTQYHVPPSMAEDFIKVWMDAADKTYDEKENCVYALRKVATMNHHFLAYGSWDSLDGWMDHHTSKHSLKMREWVADNDIMYYTELTAKLGSQKE